MRRVGISRRNAYWYSRISICCTVEDLAVMVTLLVLILFLAECQENRQSDICLLCACCSTEFDREKERRSAVANVGRLLSLKKKVSDTHSDQDGG